MNLRIITKNHAADPEIGFLEKSISNSNGCAIAIPTAWGLPSDSRRIKYAYFSDQIEIMQKLLSSELKLQTLTMFFLVNAKSQINFLLRIKLAKIEVRKVFLFLEFLIADYPNFLVKPLVKSD